MRYATVCSGIDAPRVAWEPLGWEQVWSSEIEPFPCAVLAHHAPTVPNLGDMTKIQPREVIEQHGPTDLLIGGTPCQSFSVAGLRKGLVDPRGNLALEYLRLVDGFRPTWCVWENVPGVLSSNRGRDFGTFLGALGELGYGWAYRVLDAQYCRVDGFGRAVPQRRRRVFVIGHSGGWTYPAAVLFERESVCGNTPPRRCAGEKYTDRPAACLGRGGQGGFRGSEPGEHLVAHTLRGEGFDTSEDGTGRGAPLVVNARKDPIVTRTAQPLDQDGGSQAVYFETRFARNGRGGPEEVAAPLKAESGQTGKGDAAPCVAVAKCLSTSNQSLDYETETFVAAPILASYADKQGIDNQHVDQGCPNFVTSRSQVRRLLPTECESLQGFPRDYTKIPWRGKPAGECPDGPRYKALGNSMAVNVIRWLGRRIEMVKQLTEGGR